MTLPPMQRAHQLGRYHLLDRIAFGGMAEIFRAKTFDADGHVHLVAVKRILSHLAADEDFIQMLIDEARVASLLDHKNIARVYEFSRSHDELFIAMEFVDGKDLRSLIDRMKKLGRAIPPEHVAYIGGEIALGLHAAHGSRDGSGAATALVHRDVSPSNVICAYNGEVKLCDFGIAKTTISKVKTKTGIIKGKVKYMSPEQALGRKLDHRSDLFSLGSVLYEMLTRVPPFQAPNEMELILKVRDAEVVPIRALAPQVPEGLARIVERALAKKKEDRPKSGEEMGAALRGFLLSNARGYTRATLGRFLRKLFERDIDRELRLLEEYVVGAASSDVGVNLIADALGPRATYRKFTPERKTFDTTGLATISEVAQLGDDPTNVHTAETRILERRATRAEAPASAPRRRF
jgi:serine/threonine protein kinase